MGSLGLLICGETAPECAANRTLDHLRLSIDRFSEKALSYLDGPFSEEAQSFGAFCARVVLENASAALVGRLDPFRILYLSEFQAQEGYEHGKASRSGFKWTGDVIPEEKINPDKMWSADHDVTKVSRALLSPYCDHIYWKPAAEKAIDYINENGGDAVLTAELDPENFCVSTKGRSASLYSKLSKGVHWDFFVSAIIMDEGTINDAIRDCLILISNMGLISHFVPTTYRKLEANIALDSYRTFRSRFE